MKVAAIITEYNPFHRGHAYQLSKIEADFIMVIMSGNYVQRGEPALLDKWIRTEMALKNGVDLVLELPLPAATGSADYFARAAVYLLHQTGVVSHLNFGAEHAELSDLKELAQLLLEESPDFSSEIRLGLKNGLSYGAARQLAFEKLYPHKQYAGILKGSNNILAIEYLKALTLYQSRIEPVLIKRQGQDYLDSSFKENTLLSATAIRKQISDFLNGDLAASAILHSALPEASFSVLEKELHKKNGFLFPENIYPFLRFLIMRHQTTDFMDYQDLSPELVNRFYSTLRSDSDYEDFIHKTCSKNFPASKVKRAALQIFLGMKKRYQPSSENSYLRVLGFRRDASLLLRTLQKKAKLPVITNTRNAASLPTEAKELYQTELTGDLLYQNLLLANGAFCPLSPEQRNPIIL